jgi:hypothetical protein
MNKLFQIILLTTIVVSFLCCKNEKKKFEYYVISKHDSLINAMYTKVDTGLDIPPPPPPPPNYLKWYYNIVLIFDSVDRVYLYQTEEITHSISFSVLKNFEGIDPEYPCFLGLDPSQILEFDAKSLQTFLETNNEIFHLDTNFKDFKRFFIAASTMDTIKNEAFYRLKEMFKFKTHNFHQVLYLTRIITEEEKNVLLCKKSKIFYDPKNFIWKGKYLNGNCQPLTEEYKSIEKKCYFIRHSIDTFKKECTRLPIIE